MRLILRAPIVLVDSTPLAGRIAVFLVRLVRAVALSYFVFVSHVYPISFLRWLQRPVLLAAKAVELPMSVVGLAVPSSLRPFSTWFPDPDGWIHTIPLFRNYLLIGIPTYLVLAYLFAAVASRIKNIRGGLSGRPAGTAG